MTVATSWRPQRLRPHPMTVDSALLFLKSLVAAATQTVCWLVAAHLHSPEVVGVAGSLISATVALSFFAQLGLNFSLVGLLPSSRTQASDISTALLVVGVAGLLFGAGFAVVAPRVSPPLAFLGDSPILVAVFAVLVAGSSANLLADPVFLALRAVPANLAISGVLAGCLRCLLPLALVGLGALGLVASVGLSLTVAAVLSTWWILRRLPRPHHWIRRPDDLPGVAGFAGAGYATSILDMVPLLVLPLLVLNLRGAAASGVFFVCFQVATLLTAMVLAVAMSMLAEGSRHPERVTAVCRRAARILASTVTAAVLVIIASRHLVLGVFGQTYADRGGGVLVLLALGTFGVAVNYWTLMRLRLARQLVASVVMQAVTCVAIVGIAAVGVHTGLVGVAAAWGLGQLAGGVVGLVAAVRGART